MIGPTADWKEWRWGITAGVGAGSFTAGLNAGVAIWRVSATTTGGGTVTFISLDDSAPSVVTIPAGGAFAAEPWGMYHQTVDFSAGITAWTVEFIRRVQ